MTIAPAGYKVDGKLNGEGMVFVARNPTFDKASGMFHCNLASFFNMDDYVAGEVYRERHYEIRLYSKEDRIPPASPRGMDQTERIHEYVPEVLLGWGRSSKKVSSEVEDNWPKNVYAQAYVLIGLLKEFEGFISDEAVTEPAVAEAVAATKPRRSQSNSNPTT